MVVFAVRSRSGLAQGTIIRNRAGIYFDDNEVIMTDYAQNSIPTSGVGVGALSPEPPPAYPNPVHHLLNISSSGHFRSAKIINTIGQVVMERAISGSTAIDVTSLTAGIYYLILSGQEGSTVQKIEKQ
jgi:hypothetical protein